MDAKICSQSINRLSKINLKFNQTPTKFEQKSNQNASWAAYGVNFGKITKHGPGTLFIWRLLCTKLAVFGSQDGAKMEKSRFSVLSRFLMFFGIDLGSILLPKLATKSTEILKLFAWRALPDPPQSTPNGPESFETILEGFFDGFGCQLGFQNHQHLKKNRCQDAFHLGFHFWSIYAPNLDPQIMKNRAPAEARARFLKSRPSKLTSIWHKKCSISGSIFWPSWLHLGGKLGVPNR